MAQGSRICAGSWEQYDQFVQQRTTHQLQELSVKGLRTKNQALNRTLGKNSRLKELIFVVPLLPSLTKLTIQIQSIKKEKRLLQAIADKAVKLPKLLDFEINMQFRDVPLGLSGVKELARLALDNVTALRIPSNDITPQCLSELQQMNLILLTKLDLSYNFLGVEGIQELRSLHLPNLQHLQLGNCNITAEGARVLSTLYLPQLQYLDLEQNKLGPEGMKALKDMRLSNLIAFYLAHNGIGPTGAKALISMDIPLLKTLDLRSNMLGPQGGKELSKLQAPALVNLNVYDNNLGENGVKAIMGMSLPYIQQLVITCNQVRVDNPEQLMARLRSNPIVLKDAQPPIEDDLPKLPPIKIQKQHSSQFVDLKEQINQHQMSSQTVQSTLQSALSLDWPSKVMENFACSPPHIQGDTISQPMQLESIQSSRGNEVDALCSAESFSTHHCPDWDHYENHILSRTTNQTNYLRIKGVRAGWDKHKGNMFEVQELPQLKHLILTLSDWDNDKSVLNDIQQVCMPNLETYEVNLRNCRLGVVGIEELGRMSITKVTKLDLSNNDLNYDAIQQLLLIDLGNVHTLQLEWNGLGGDDVQELSNLHLPQLRDIHIEIGNYISTKDMKLLKYICKGDESAINYNSEGGDVPEKEQKYRRNAPPLSCKPQIKISTIGHVQSQNSQQSNQSDPSNSPKYSVSVGVTSSAEPPQQPVAPQAKRQAQQVLQFEDSDQEDTNDVEDGISKDNYVSDQNTDDLWSERANYGHSSALPTVAESERQQDQNNFEQIKSPKLTNKDEQQTVELHSAVWSVQGTIDQSEYRHESIDGTRVDSCGSAANDNLQLADYAPSINTRSNSAKYVKQNSVDRTVFTTYIPEDVNTVPSGSDPSQLTSEQSEPYVLPREKFDQQATKSIKRSAHQINSQVEVLHNRNAGRQLAQPKAFSGPLHATEESTTHNVIQPERQGSDYKSSLASFGPDSLASSHNVQPLQDLRSQTCSAESGQIGHLDGPQQHRTYQTHQHQSHVQPGYVKIQQLKPDGLQQNISTPIQRSFQFDESSQSEDDRI